MEKRRNTLDRFQRLGFGRKSSNIASATTSLEADKSSTTKNLRSSEKSEKLKELTELLRGNRSSQTPPPVPPPRKPRSGNQSMSSSQEKPDTQVNFPISASVNDNYPAFSHFSHDDIILMDQDEQVADTTNISIKKDMSKPSKQMYATFLRDSICNKSPPPIATVDAELTSSDVSTQLARPESRTIIGSYTQKGIPFRSASFSQIDFSSRNQNKPTLSVLRDRLRRDKAVDEAYSKNVLERNVYLKRIDAESPETKLLKEKLETDLHHPTKLLKKTELNVHLRYGQKMQNDLDTISISEEEIFNPETKHLCTIADVKNEIISLVTASHARTESLTDTIHSENDYTIDEAQLPLTVESKNLCNFCVDEGKEVSGSYMDEQNVQIIDPNLAQLMEEKMLFEPPPDNFLQTATTCLIPVPVFECAAQEWRLENPPHEWVEVTPEEFGIIPETLSPLVSLEHCSIAQVEAKSDYQNCIDKMPTISVSHSPEETDEKMILPQRGDINEFYGKHEARIDFRDGKKRYSYDDMELDFEKRSSKEGITARNNGEERKRIDKSRRRKGMYIENEDWTNCTQANKGLALNISAANCETIEKGSPGECEIMYINSPVIDDNQTPGSLYSLELNTPESECNKTPSWLKDSCLTSFSCESSEDQVDRHGLKSFSDNEVDSTGSLPCSQSNSSQFPHDDFKRYSKRPLRGPYGQMLEAEMKKPNKMHFEEILEELRESDTSALSRRQRNNYDGMGGRSIPKYSNSMRVRKLNTYLPVPTHARAASTPSKIDNFSETGDTVITADSQNFEEKLILNPIVGKQTHTEPQNVPREIKRASSEVPTSTVYTNKRIQSLSGEKLSKRSLDRLYGIDKTKDDERAIKPTQKLLAELLKGSSENVISEQRQQMLTDTRTHVVQEIFKNEQSYVESLQTVVSKYLKVLKSPEHAGMIDTRTVDEIFFMVPDILEIHEKFLFELKARLDNWSILQKVGDAFIETFSKLEVLEVYTSFVNNCNRAKNAIRTTKHQRPSFAKFLELTAREHKGKLTLDNLLIKPVQKFPNYEMLFQRLIKHTDHDHPDQKHLQEVLKLVHDILVHINCKEREILENGQREATLRELEGVIEGITDLITPDRHFLLFDLVSMPSGQGARKERGFFLFNDLLVLTSIKKRSGTIRKPNTSTCPVTVASTLDTNKYKFLTKISLDCLDIVKNKDENVKRAMNDIENLVEDCNKLQQISEITSSLKYPHQYLEDVIRELQREVHRQLSERQTNDTQLNMLELTVNSPNGSQKLSVVFTKPEKRSSWQEIFNEAKQKLAATLERHPIPEFLTSIPIRKTRAGLQFTCAAATLSEKRDVWVCNSDGYVGQVCIMSLHPEPNVESCNGVCNARILCVTSVPAFRVNKCISKDDLQHSALHNHSYTQQLRDFRKSISPNCQSKTVIGTEQKKSPMQSSEVNVSNSKDHMINAGTSNNNNDIHLDLNLSSSDEEADVAGSVVSDASSIISSTERVPSPAQSVHAVGSLPTASNIGSTSTTTIPPNQDSSIEDGDGNQSTMWIGTEDGCIHIYNSTDNIRIKKNRIKIEHHSAVYSILYLDNRVFVALANGDICVYLRDGIVWNTTSSHCISIGTVTSPVTKLLNVHGKLWCSIQGIIKVLDVQTLLVTNQIQISSDSKPITNMTLSNNFVWISIQNSAHIKCFHSISYQLITEVNLAPAVNKMLSNCDEIIRQHKAACLRVTSLLSCKDLIWIGTSAGVLLTIPSQCYEKSTHNIVPTGIPHGHTGHVRFLTFVETSGLSSTDYSFSGNVIGGTAKDFANQSAAKQQKSNSESNNILIISGGDGYEDFRNSGANSLSEIAGREDSTNHLLIWQI